MVVVVVRDRRKLLGVWIFYGETGGGDLFVSMIVYIYIYYIYYIYEPFFIYNSNDGTQPSYSQKRAAF